MAYKMYDIKLSPNKSTFFPDSFKILGLTLSPGSSELTLDRVKAQSILDWEKPDSLYTLQSRLYALNYWTKFIPALAELKFPLQQIVRSQIFCWTEEADQAWERIKAIIALDIRLTIPEQEEQLVLTTDASKIACSCILWVARGSSLRVVGCYSKLFAHTDTLKSIHFKETYALVLAFDHFRAYLLNTDKSVIVFTDARALMWVGRNREYSIACNGLVNKLAKIQLEIPHVVYSVPSEVNYLADVFSRAFSTSRFLEKNQLAMSKPQANNLPLLTEPFLATEEALYQFFALPLHSEESDVYSRKRSKISTPKPVSSLYKLFKDCTPEEKYLSAIRLLQGWDDPQLSGGQALARHQRQPDDHAHRSDRERSDHGSHADRPFEVNSCSISNRGGPPSQEENVLSLMKRNHRQHYKKLIEKAVSQIVAQKYSDLDLSQKERIKLTLWENMDNFDSTLLLKILKDDFIQAEKEKDSLSLQVNLLEANDQITIPVRYSVIDSSCLHPSRERGSPGIRIPVQQDMILQPGDHETIDTGVQFFLPANLCLQLMPSSASAEVKLYVHSEFVSNNFSSTIKFLIRNDSNSPIRINAGNHLVQTLIVPVLSPALMHDTRDTVEPQQMNAEINCVKLNEDDVESSLITNSCTVSLDTVALNNFELSELTHSCLHRVVDSRAPRSIHILQLNANVMLPEAGDARTSIMADLVGREHRQADLMLAKHLIPVSMSNQDIHSVVIEITQMLMEGKAELNASEAKEVIYDPNAKDTIHEDMCRKLAVISVDLIRNQAISGSVLAKAQQSDDHLHTIREEVLSPDNKFPLFVIKNEVLYKKYPTGTGTWKWVICLPDVLLPSVIHKIHHDLGHASATTTKRNFQHYYHHRNAARMVQSYVNSCVTCALAQKFNIKKTAPETTRSLQPTRPRQYIYCDLIPMYRGTLSYILFCLDAYSQFVYAIPLNPNTSASVLQGFLALFATTGWPEAIYLDNETSFQKAAKMLVKLTPVKVLYSTPYCQFQNWSENYIKNFKRTFLKILNDSEDPHDNSDWPVLLPTVTEALNRQIIPALGRSRESIHFNLVSDFFPLAHISNEANEDLNESVNSQISDAFQTVLRIRKNARTKHLKKTIPQFHETQLVFVRDNAPSISTILKIPNRGPYRIEKLEDRNVTLVELETGKTVHSHIQNIRPLELSEFRLILSKNWDLNVNEEKSSRIKNDSIFDSPQNIISEEVVLESEQEQDFEGQEQDFEEQEQDRQGQDLQTLFAQDRPAIAEPSADGEVPIRTVQNVRTPVPPDIQENRSPIILRRSSRIAARNSEISHSEFSDPEEIVSEDDTNFTEEIVSKDDTIFLHKTVSKSDTDFNTEDVHLEASQEYKSILKKNKKGVSFFIKRIKNAFS